MKLRINHTLLTKSGGSLENIREIYSHEQGLNQCSEFLRNNPQIKATVCENTAVAAKMVADSDRSDIAAISSRSARSSTACKFYRIISRTATITILGSSASPEPRKSTPARIR